MTGVRTLDRYVFGSWIRIFVLTALGFPLVSILINLTDTLNKLLDRGLTMREIAISYVYSIPENVFLVMPAAVLFATVFTVGGDGPPLGAHRGQGRRHELPPAHAADLRRRGASPPGWPSWWARWRRAPRPARRRSRRPSRRAPPARATTSSTAPTPAGSTPSARSTWPPGSSSSCCSSARARGRRLPGPHHHRRQRQLRRHARRSWRVPERHQPGHRRARASRRCSRSAPCGSGHSPSRRPTCWPSRRRPDEMRYAELGRYIDALQAVGQRRQQADRRAGAQAGAAGHLPHHRAVRRAARGAAPRGPAPPSASRSASARRSSSCSSPRS